MAYAHTPTVHRGILVTEQGERIVLDSPQWQAWLEEATCFSYASHATGYRFTARKERRRQRWYWYAYLKHDTKLHNAYLGPAQSLTIVRLDRVGQALARKVARLSSSRGATRPGPDAVEVAESQPMG